MENSNPFEPGSTVDAPAPTDNASEPAKSKSSVIPPTVIALLLPFPSGLGLWAMGYTKRFRFWAVASTASFVTMVLGGIVDSPTVGFVGFALAILSMAAAFFDTAFRKPVRSRSTAQVGVTVTAVFVGALIGMSVLRHKVIEAFAIPAGSMMPSLLIGDQIWVSKLDRDFRRGDVVVFDFPPQPTIQYVKRIVGMPGETISSEDGRSISINGVPYAGRDTGVCEAGEETFNEMCHDYVESVADAAYHIWTTGRSGFSAIKIPEDSFFVMGDNRDNSNDSRAWGFVPRSLIKGKVQFVFWSTQHPGRIGTQVGRDTGK